MRIINNITTALIGRFVVCVGVRVAVHAIANIFVDVSVKIATNHEKFPLKYSKPKIKYLYQGKS